MHWILNITYGEVINGLNNKSITTHGFISALFHGQYQ